MKRDTHTTNTHTAAANRRRSWLLAVMVATMLTVPMVCGTAVAGAAVTPALRVLLDPPVASPDIFETDQLHMDNGPAGGCVDYSTVADPTFAASTDMRIWMNLGYVSDYRENLVHAAAADVRRAGAHLAIWLYHWNGSSWVWAGQTRFRYPTTTSPYWSRPAGDSTATNVPNFWVRSNSGYYTIRVGIVSAAGALLDSGYVAGFGHGDISAIGITRNCMS
jgi:hypothetical protein